MPNFLNNFFLFFMAHFAPFLHSFVDEAIYSLKLTSCGSSAELPTTELYFQLLKSKRKTYTELRGFTFWHTPLLKNIL